MVRPYGNDSGMRRWARMCDRPIRDVKIVENAKMRVLKNCRFKIIFNTYPNSSKEDGLNHLFGLPSEL